MGVSEASADTVGYDNWISNVGKAEWNIRVGSAYLGYLLYNYGGGSDITVALRKYRMGPNSKDKNGTGGRYAKAIKNCAKCVRENKDQCKDHCFNMTIGKGL